MKSKNRESQGHTWHFIQTGGLVQVKITSIDDILNLDKLDPKLWIALACPVKGLEFSEETLSLLDSDKNGRVRVPEILEAVEYIKKYFKNPGIIMEPGETIPLDALGDEPFACGHSPADSARAVLDVLGKGDATEIALTDITENDKLFSATVMNGDGVLPPDAAKDELSAGVITDIVACTGGTEDISGAKGTSREQFQTFFADLRAVKEWRESAQKDAPDIFFLKYDTDAAASALRAVSEKIDDFFLRCSLGTYNTEVASTLRKKEEEGIMEGAPLTEEQLAKLPLAVTDNARVLPLGDAVNPAWRGAMATFAAAVVEPIWGAGKTTLTADEWKETKAKFAPYQAWYDARPQNSVGALSFERMDEILASDAEQLIEASLTEEEKHPPIALATVDLKKMILYRRDFVELVRNFVSFENFYAPDTDAVFQCGRLYIDGRSCDLCFKVTDAAKHGTMSPLSQCYLLYCTCTRQSTGQTMDIAAMVSAGNRDNFMVGRNGLFFDRAGNDWDATITKIVENPISIREAFWSPYKKLMRMVQERIAKSAADAESKVDSKMAAAVENPNAAASEAKGATAATKKPMDIGTVAALGVAVSGIASVIGIIVGIITQRWYMPVVFIVGLLLIISLPSMFLAWTKLRQRNIAPILDASGWAVNGNVKINIPLGALLTTVGVRPKGSKLDSYDPYAQKKFPIKRVLLALVLLALIVGAVVVIAKNGWNVFRAWDSVRNFFTGLFSKAAATVQPPAPAAE